MAMDTPDTMPVAAEKVQGQPHAGAQKVAAMFSKKKKKPPMPPPQAMPMKGQ